MKPVITVIFSLFFFLFKGEHSKAQNAPGSTVIDLSGKWKFSADPESRGDRERWFLRDLAETVLLPGSMTGNGKGDDITVHTPWTGTIVDSSWFRSPDYEVYRRPGNIKIPFWLQPVKYYKGAAWYQKSITIPVNWKGKEIQLYVERSHWNTTVWLDGKKIGFENSMGTAQTFSLGMLKPGSHKLTVKVDNRVTGFNVGENSHSISDHTQSNWNGMIGKLNLIAKESIEIENIQVFPDVQQKKIDVKVTVINRSGKNSPASITLFSSGKTKQTEKLQPLKRSVVIDPDTSVLNFQYNMGDKPHLWSEFDPFVYLMNVSIDCKAGLDTKAVSFGMRNFRVKGNQLELNDTPVFLRGTLECAIFPKTGYPPMDKAAWVDIMRVVKSYGLNHIRFHSWTPPEAAFDAADELGLYLQIECSSWANNDSRIGSGDALDKWIYKESEKVVRSYGNHPSFVMMAYGNEPNGDHSTEFLVNFVKYWQRKDSRRLYTTAAGWPVVAGSDFNLSPDPRVQGWGEGLKSIINAKAPGSGYDWSSIISRWGNPTVSHEIGQWCVYPDFKEIEHYTGVLKAKNFEIFRDKLRENRMLALADSFLLASGKLQTLCYKADIEASLRTKAMGGFQLLDLHDFPGQGTALVGVLNSFWKEKGYVTAREYSQFCNAVVPLARFPRMVFTNGDTLNVPVEVAQYGSGIMRGAKLNWQVKAEDGRVMYEGKFIDRDLPVGNGISLGTVLQDLRGISKPSRLILTVNVGDFTNSWDFFVYPDKKLQIPASVMVSSKLDATVLEKLNSGGSVLVSLPKGSINAQSGGNIAVGFSSIFWNTAWTNRQAPHTLGLLIDPRHAAFSEFPTQYHSNWQWWDAMSHADALILDSLHKDLKPLIRVIDDWVTARPLGLAVECKVGKGRLLLSTIDVLTDGDKRIEARQLLQSFVKYMDSPSFKPDVAVTPGQLKNILR